jgi:hypothetical protein
MRIAQNTRGEIMLEAIKGLNILNPKFYVPVLIGLVFLFIIVKVAKKLVKLAVFVVIIALALLIYFNMPSIKVDGSVATLKIKGQEYMIDTKNVKIANENSDGKSRVYLVSGSEKIELPFSKDYAERFIMDKLNKD